MSSRVPSPSYSVFLYEKMTLFKLKSLKEGGIYQLTPYAQFLETCVESSFTEQNLLRELYLKEMACPMDPHSKPVPYLGDVQLRSFSYFVNNHVQWESVFQTISQNEASSSLWIRIEPQSPRVLLMFHERRLTYPMKTQQLMELQEKVIYTYVNQISKQQHLSLEGSKNRWQTSSLALKKKGPLLFQEF